jgi:hypothetical protein
MDPPAVEEKQGVGQQSLRPGIAQAVAALLADEGRVADKGRARKGDKHPSTATLGQISECVKLPAAWVKLSSRMLRRSTAIVAMPHRKSDAAQKLQQLPCRMRGHYP